MEYKMEIEEECIKSLDAAIAGDHTQLDCAFAWADTPQGHSYWSQQASGITPLDIPALKEIKRQCVDAPAETGTLKELNVKAGDVVEFDGGSRFTVSEKKHHLIGSDGLDAYYACWDTAEFFRIISRASDADDTPKTWGEMTDAEKGALLLAWQRGEVIEWLGCGAWDETCAPVWSDKLCYRVKPEHKRETVTLYGGKDRVWGFFTGAAYVETHRITFDIIDGKPDCTTVKMEAVE